VFGIFGGGNSGNEASLDAMLNHVRSRYPDAVIDAMSGGFRQVPAKHGIPAVPLSWHEFHEQAPRPARAILKAFGKAADPLRMLLWVSRHDVVVVPGMGVLEDTTPLRAYGFPLAMFLLSASGRVSRVKVGLVSVGASVIKRRATRFLLTGAARMASYRSYRDAYSMEAMRQGGVGGDAQVFPDLVFSLPVPPYDPGDPLLVGVGVMDYNGGNNDRARAVELHSAYLQKMTSFVRWLLENGYRVQFFGGDDMWDYAIADEITERVRADRPGIAVESLVAARPFDSYADFLSELNRAGTVVATRYHNVLGAVKLCKPTIAIGYAHKFVPLMESVGLADFTQSASALDADLLIKQFKEIQARHAEIMPVMMSRNAANAENLARQFAIIDSKLFGDSA
jgi:polysaccharide pyruvyl transferase WcaK-like protein